MVQLVLELLSHCTPPSCIPANILTVCSLVFPNHKVVEELPSGSFVRHCCSILSVETKTLAAYNIARAPLIVEDHSDGTARRQTHVQNSICRVASGAGYRSITLDSAILAEDETSEMLTESILRTFKKGRGMLEQLRSVTKRMFPGRNDLLNLIPEPSELSLSKLAKGGWIMTDTCNPARKFRKLLIEAISEIACKEGMDKAEIKVYEADCWHHLHNVWFGTVINKLGDHVNGAVITDIERIHFSLRVNTDVDGTLCAVEKYFWGEANYAKVRHNCSFVAVTFNANVRYCFLALGKRIHVHGLHEQVPSKGLPLSCLSCMWRISTRHWM